MVVVAAIFQNGGHFLSHDPCLGKYYGLKLDSGVYIYVFGGIQSRKCSFHSVKSAHMPVLKMVASSSSFTLLEIDQKKLNNQYFESKKYLKNQSPEHFILLLNYSCGVF